MNREERSNEFSAVLFAALQGLQAGLWTALPGKVQSFNAEEQTVTALPMIQARVTQQDGSQVWIDLPLLVDVPVVFPRAGGYVMTFPVKPLDECLLILSSRSIDSWWDQGSQGPAIDLRMHDLSDAFCLLGPASRPNAVSSIATDGVVLRSEDNSARIKIADSGTISVVAPNDVFVTAGGNLLADVTGNASVTAGSATVTASTIALIGNVSITGTLAVAGNAAIVGNLGTTGTIIDGTGKSLGTHVHTQNNVNQPLTGPPQ